MSTSRPRSKSHGVRTLLMAATMASSPAHAWWDAQWGERTPITIDGTPLTSDVANLTVLVAIDGSRVDYGRTQNDGDDIRFVADDDSTVLAHQIEDWNESGTSLVWVSLPLVRAGTDTDFFYLYYDNGSAGSGEDVENTWDTYTSLVYHMHTEPPVDDISGVDTTNHGSDRVAGFLGDGRRFDGNNDDLESNRALDDMLGVTSTLEFWIRSTDPGDAQATSAPGVLGWRKGSTPETDLFWGWLSNDGGIGMKAGHDVLGGTVDVADDAWHHVVLSRSITNGKMRVYVDGALDREVTGGTDGLTSNAIEDVGVVAGSGGLPTNFLAATLDEMRVHSVARTPGWVLANYLSMRDQLLVWCQPVPWYRDQDVDDYGNPLVSVDACEAPAGFVANDRDCDDTDADINPGAPEVCDPADVDEDCDQLADDDDPNAQFEDDWWRDLDRDGYGGGNPIRACDSPGPNYVRNGQDCDDADPAEHPGAEWYLDLDQDGFGDPNQRVVSCTRPPGRVPDDRDCDDSDPEIHPYTEWFRDADGDGFGNPNLVVLQCTRPNGYVRDDTDCDDDDGDLNPDTIWYRDADGDGYGVPSPTQTGCARPPGYADNAADCDDTDPEEHPGAQWWPDEDGDGYGAGDPVTSCTRPPDHVGNDLDCDDGDPDLNPDTIWYHDADHDGFGDPADPDHRCTAPNDHVDNDLDCDDGDADVHPDADELCDGIDNDCDGDTDLYADQGGSPWYPDADRDGYGNPDAPIRDCRPRPGYIADSRDCDDDDPDVHPGALESCGDGVDSDCDGGGGPEGDDDGDGLDWTEEQVLGSDDCDLDSDEDTVPDAVEGPLGDSDTDGAFDVVDIDDDNDTIVTAFEGQGNGEDFCPYAFDTVPNYLDLDADGDGILDYDEGTLDTDGDGIPNFLDCSPDGCDGDQDGDGIANCDEADYGTAPWDPDTDHDRVDDLTEAGGDPRDLIALDTDLDDLMDALDEDDDGDGLATALEDPDGDGRPADDDTDLDGAANHRDRDDDGDGLDTPLEDRNGDGDPRDDDTDRDAVPDFLDPDDDGDGIPTSDEDRDGDGEYDDDDTDGDGVPDHLDPFDADGPWADPDGDGLPNEIDPAPYDADADGDGVPDGLEAPPADADADGIVDLLDDDDDGDGVPTSEEPAGDTDGDGIPNRLDLDSDGDGIPDGVEDPGDTDCDGVPELIDGHDDGSCEGGPTATRALRFGSGCQTPPAPGSALPWWALAALAIACRRLHG